MSDLLANLWLGFHVAANPFNILFCLLGALVGTLVGVLPGVGSVATIAMLLPITFGLPPVGPLIMPAGIYTGAQYGGSPTSLLVNTPGEATSVITCLDGHQMARQGRAGPALSIAAIGSFFAGCVATVLVAALGAPLTSLALLFGPAEYFSLMVLGLIFAVVLAKGSVLKAVAMVLTGLLLSMVGSDLETGAGRMTFDVAELADGIGFTNIAMGVFGFAEIIRNLELPSESRDIVSAKVTGLMPKRQDLIDSAGAIARGTVLGSILGILPGGGAMIASMWIGNLMLVIINLPLVGVWVSLLRVPYRLLYPSIIVFCCIGVYSINNSPTDVVIAAMFGVIGFWLIKHDFEGAPMLLGFVLGPLMEENLRRAMLIARGDATVFFTRPISGVLLSTAIILLIIAGLPKIRRRRDEVFVE